MTGKVDYSIQDGIAEAIIDNPPVNATSAGVRAGLADAVKRFEADASAKALVIRCAGKTFVAGADISQFNELRSSPETVAKYDGISDEANRRIAADLQGI